MGGVRLGPDRILSPHPLEKPPHHHDCPSKSLNPLRLYTNLFPSQTPKPPPQEIANSNHKAQILKEERTIERELIKAITTRKLNPLKPNSGRSVPIGKYYVCVSYHEESDFSCRVWEWHGHMVFYNDENGYTQECMYGNYFERMMMMMRKVFRDESDEEDESHEERISGLISRRSHRLIGEAMNGEVLSPSTNKKWCHQLQKYRYSSNGVGREMWEKRENRSGAVEGECSVEGFSVEGGFSMEGAFG
ncbi:hypothetical protein CFP56_035875 [Quercus suber]|uniref:Uncharacterized protein n=1 Tax=Quercus suber TaxID=58331 RepID=A0AAW0J8I1_QUESU